jgi:dihydroorotase
MIVYKEPLKNSKMNTIIRNATIINEGKIFNSDIFIKNERIEKISSSISIDPQSNFHEINGENLHLIPGMIDDQVHFREPGLTHKATIFDESKAAIAGGVTSFMDMPNTIPNTITLDLLEEKFDIASKNSLANYSFFMGICQDNFEELLKVDNEKVCGISDDGLYFNNENSIIANHPEFLEKLFSNSNSLIALHSEDEHIVNQNLAKYSKEYGENIPFSMHAKIRTEEACIVATERILKIAKRTNCRLHILHLTTGHEANLMENNIPLSKKRITSEVCIHHLWFNEDDYESKGAMIKWNPSVKSKENQKELLKALLDNKIDIIASDHAPHLISEKKGNYRQSMSGGPLVQHSLSALLEMYHQKMISLEEIVQKTSHNVAEIYKIKERGYIREGYYADLALIDLHNPWKVSHENILYKCGWSPFDEVYFQSKVDKTFVNGSLIYDNGIFNPTINGKRLLFYKDR